MSYFLIINSNLFAVQVCVPKDAKDEEIIAFVESELPSGTRGGWQMCQDGAKALGGDPACVACDQNPETRVHRVVEC